MLLLTSVLAASPCLHGSALAQDDAGYQTAIAGALAEFERGNYDEALVLFREAHHLEPSARTLRGLGNVTFELRRYVEAVEYFEASLVSEARPLTDEMRAEVMALLSRARAFVGRLTIALTPEHAVVLVDGVAASADSVLAVGAHDVVVSLDGYNPFSTRVTVDGGETETLTVILLPVGGAAVDEPAVRAMTPASDGLLIPAIAVMSAGALVLGAFAALGALALDEQSRVAAGCGAGRTCTPAEVRTMDDLALGADVLLGVGAATLVAGLIMILVEPPHGEQPATATLGAAPWIEPASAGLVAVGTF